MIKFLKQLFTYPFINPRGDHLSKKAHLKDFTNEELLQFLEILEDLSALELGVLCAEILRRMKPDLREGNL